MNRVEIILPISRSEHLPTLFAQLEHMDCDPNQTSLLCYVDGDMALLQQTQTFVDHAKFINKRCIQRVQDTLKPSKFSTTERRLRISKIHNELREFIGDCDYILGLEDDTIPPTNMLKRLLHDYALYPYAGFIEGVELGRWGFPYVGAWRTDNVYDVTNIKSCLPLPLYQTDDYNHIKQGVTIEEIDAGGFYCFITKCEHYIKHEFKPYGRDVLGPDVEFGLNLRREGYKNYIDWSLICKHMRSDGSALELGITPVIGISITKTIRGDREIWIQKMIQPEEEYQNIKQEPLAV